MSVCFEFCKRKEVVFLPDLVFKMFQISLLLNAFVANLTKTVPILAISALFFACGTTKPHGHFDKALIPAKPDYANLKYWAAHPDKQDPADRTPCPRFPDQQGSATVDVFFLHPTTYTGSSKDQKAWNAALEDQATNDKTDQSTILFQASIFNGVGRVFAPRYRQGHLDCFYSKDKQSAQAALDVAYNDLRAAFEHYMQYWNGGRPFIIAAHSQGAFHAMRLLKEAVEGTPRQQQLVVAYSVGYPLPKNYFKYLKPCETPEETGCFCTWRTFERKYGLAKAKDTTIVCTNPLTWSTKEGVHAPASANKGGVLRPFCAVYPAIADAQVYKGVLLCEKPKFPGSVLLFSKNYHPGDLNLYYLNVRENAQVRAKAFQK